MGKVEDEKGTSLGGRIYIPRGRRVRAPYHLRHKTGQIFPPGSPLTSEGIAKDVQENYGNSYDLAAIDTLTRMGLNVEGAEERIEKDGLGHYINGMLPEAERKLAIRETEGRGSATDMQLGLHRLKMMRDWYFKTKTPPEGFPTSNNGGTGSSLTERVEEYRTPGNPNSQ